MKANVNEYAIDRNWPHFSEVEADIVSGSSNPFTCTLGSCYSITLTSNTFENFGVNKVLQTSAYDNVGFQNGNSGIRIYGRILNLVDF